MIITVIFKYTVNKLCKKKIVNGACFENLGVKVPWQLSLTRSSTQASLWGLKGPSGTALHSRGIVWSNCNDCVTCPLLG